MLSSYVFAFLAAASAFNAMGIEQVFLYNSLEDCQNNNPPLVEYTPTCEGNRFQFSSFNAVGTVGNGVFGTSRVQYVHGSPGGEFNYVYCQILVVTAPRFSDPNCQNSIGQTGNHVGIDLQCNEFDGAQSQKCFRLLKSGDEIF